MAMLVSTIHAVQGKDLVAATDEHMEEKHVPLDTRIHRIAHGLSAIDESMNTILARIASQPEKELDKAGSEPGLATSLKYIEKQVGLIGAKVQRLEFEMFSQQLNRSEV